MRENKMNNWSGYDPNKQVIIASGLDPYDQSQWELVEWGTIIMPAIESAQDLKPNQRRWKKEKVVDQEGPLF